MPRFDEEDDELLSYIKEYERFIKDNRNDLRDFDEWFEDEYGDSKKKVMKPSKRGRADSGDGR